MAGFPRSRRLTTRRDFSRVFRDAGRSRDRLFTVLARRNCGAGARLGVAVSRKTDKRAVARNRIKRHIRESFRHASLPSIDIVVISQPAAGKASARSVRESLTRHWARLTSLSAEATDRP
ncbi:MAG: ribonuclease P protein component [Pseudomonadota bacterium]